MHRCRQRALEKLTSSSREAHSNDTAPDFGYNAANKICTQLPPQEWNCECAYSSFIETCHSAGMTAIYIGNELTELHLGDLPRFREACGYFPRLRPGRTRRRHPGAIFAQIFRLLAPPGRADTEASFRLFAGCDFSVGCRTRLTTDSIVLKRLIRPTHSRQETPFNYEAGYPTAMLNLGRQSPFEYSAYPC
jgi:hypothetical protein